MKQVNIQIETVEALTPISNTPYGHTYRFTSDPNAEGEKVVIHTKSTEVLLRHVHEALGDSRHMFFIDRKLGDEWAREIVESVYPERLIDGRWVDCIDATIQWKDAEEHADEYERVTFCLTNWDELYSDTLAVHKEWLEDWDEAIFYYLDHEELKSIKQEDSHDEWSIVDW
jgi:hypothetical protein